MSRTSAPSLRKKSIAASMPERVASDARWSVSKKCRTTPMRRPFTPLPNSAVKSGTGRSTLAGSAGSWPAMPCSSSAQSSAVQAIGPGVIEREGQRQDAAPAGQAIGRLDAGDAAQRRRPADRTAGVGAGAAQNQAGGDGRAGAGRRSGGEVVSVPGIARRRPGQVEGWPAEGEFVRRELAQHDRARVGPFLHRVRVRASAHCVSSSFECAVVRMPAVL